MFVRFGARYVFFSVRKGECAHERLFAANVAEHHAANLYGTDGVWRNRSNVDGLTMSWYGVMLEFLEQEVRGEVQKKFGVAQFLARVVFVADDECGGRAGNDLMRGNVGLKQNVVRERGWRVHGEGERDKAKSNGNANKHEVEQESQPGESIFSAISFLKPVDKRKYGDPSRVRGQTHGLFTDRFRVLDGITRDAMVELFYEGHTFRPI